MIIGRSRFNIYLLCSLIALGCGCHTTTDKDKQFSTLAVHLEVVPNDFSMEVQVWRDKPFSVTVDKSPFLDESQVTEARVMDVPGGFALQIKFERRGASMLEQYTTTNPGKHLAIYATYGDKKRCVRWLAAPLITRRNSTGILSFTPDATREEAEQVALGLNNLAKKIAKKSKW